jgi:hypothetical protein
MENSAALLHNTNSFAHQSTMMEKRTTTRRYIQPERSSTSLPTVHRRPARGGKEQRKPKLFLAMESAEGASIGSIGTLTSTKKGRGRVALDLDLAA